jgi:hypothetical protein
MAWAGVVGFRRSVIHVGAEGRNLVIEYRYGDDVIGRVPD